MIGKIEDQHRQKAAYIYLRQSSMAQVRHHQESTERQYALKEKALELGWTPAMIRTLDRDLGISGAQMTGREDFKTLMADVCMGKVGAVFALEASRLGRSCADWYRLMEFCALTNTLIIDEDGCYDTGNFNDRLLLGLKATMSQAELHFMSLRLQGGKLNKAKKGELRFPLPVGFCYDPEGAPSSIRISKCKVPSASSLPPSARPAAPMAWSTTLPKRLSSSRNAPMAGSGMAASSGAV